MRDNGVGVAAEHLSEIFQPFSKPPGQGAIVRIEPPPSVQVEEQVDSTGLKP